MPFKDFGSIGFRRFSLDTNRVVCVCRACLRVCVCVYSKNIRLLGARAIEEDPDGRKEVKDKHRKTQEEQEQVQDLH